MNLGMNECSCEQVNNEGPVREEKDKRNMGDVEQNRNPRLGGMAPTFRKFPSLREATFRGQSSGVFNRNGTSPSHCSNFIQIYNSF